MKKTIKIEVIVEKANNYFKNSEDIYKNERKHLAVFVENILCETGNYEGFKYLSEEEMESSVNGKNFGINVGTPDLFLNTDSSRIKFY